MARLNLTLLVAILCSACAGSPTAPASSAIAATPPGDTWLVSGQSNAMNLTAPLRALHPSLISVAETGMPISGWAPGQPTWLQLEPQLRQPLRAFIWFQGESDWQASDTPPAGYEAALRSVFARVRQANGNPKMLIVVCGLATRYVRSIGSVQQAIVAGDADMIYVRSDDLPNDGSTHLFGDGLPMMARRVADAIAQRLGR